jgi:hypothetical protein
MSSATALCSFCGIKGMAKGAQRPDLMLYPVVGQFEISLPGSRVCLSAIGALHHAGFG